MVDLVEERNISVGQCLLLIDCGQGTLDIAVVKLIREQGAAHLMELQRVGECSGNGVGSHKINTAAEEWLLSGKCAEIESRGGFDVTCRQLGMSRREFLRGFSDGIDMIKEDIDQRNVFSVRVFNPHENVAPGLLSDVTISIPRAPLTSWYATWTGSAKQLLKDHLSTLSSEVAGDIAWGVLSGGGAKSSRFRTEMEAVLSEYQIPAGAPQSDRSACSKGALLQHLFQEDSPPPDAYFYIAQTEPYNPTIHLDALGDPSLIHQDDFDTSLSVVRNRLRRVMRASDRRPLDSPEDAPDEDDSDEYDSEEDDFDEDASEEDDPDETTLMSEGYIPQTFYVETGIEPRIHVDVFWSLTPLDDHCALYDTQDEITDGVNPYPLIFVDDVQFGELGFTVHQENNGKLHYLVNGFVKMELTDTGLDLTVYLMTHDYVFPQGLLGPAPTRKGWTTFRSDEAPFEEDEVLTRYKKEMWGKGCSHFVSSNTGASRSHSDSTFQGGVVANEGTRKSERFAKLAKLAIETAASKCT
jgi:hypothetical protein